MTELRVLATAGKGDERAVKIFNLTGESVAVVRRAIERHDSEGASVRFAVSSSAGEPVLIVKSGGREWSAPLSATND